MKQQVVIIGGGFAGLAALRELSNKVDITLIDRASKHTFLPGIKKYAFGLLNDSAVQYSFEGIAQKYGATFIQSEVETLEQGKKQVILKHQHQIVKYDYLLITTGADAIRGEQREVCWNIEDAKKIRARKEELKKVIIIGGGVLGSEIAAHFADYTKAKVTIIQSGERLVKTLPKKVSEKVERYLKKKKVELVLNKRVESATTTTVKLDTETLKADLVIWTIGAHPVNPFTENKNIIVDEYLQVKEHMFGAGDCVTPKTGKPFAQRVPTAEAQGTIAAKNILATIDKKEKQKYVEKSIPILIALGNKPLLHFKIFGKHIVLQHSILQLLSKRFLRKHTAKYC